MSVLSKSKTISCRGSRCACRKISTSVRSTAASSRMIFLLALLFPQLRRPQLHTVEGALARQGGALIADAAPIFPAQILFLYQHRQQRIAPQLVVIVQILVAQSQSVNPLCHQLRHRVFHQFRIPIVRKAARELADDASPLLDFAQQQTPSVTGNASTVKLPAYFSLI